MSIVFNAEDARRFLSRLAPPEGQCLEMRVIVPDRGPSQFFSRTIEEALSIAERFSGRANVYVGACPRFREGGKKEDVNTVVAFWADLDFHQIHDDRYEARAIALERVFRFEFPPSMLVMTGNGVQGWWLLDKPVAITEAWPAERLEAVNRGIAERLSGDHVHDLPRVLRVPGTWNLPDARKRARGCARVLSRLLVADGPTHDPSAFPVARVAPRREAPARRSPQVADRRSGEVVGAFLDLVSELDRRHPLACTWYGRRELRDSSRSGWDMALTYQLLVAGVREEYVMDLLRVFSLGRGSEGTDAYFRRTLSKARGYIEDRCESA